MSLNSSFETVKGQVRSPERRS